MVSIHCPSYCYWDKIPWSTATCGGWRREEVSFTHISIQQSIIQSSPESGRNLGAVRDVETLEGCSLLTCSVCLAQPALFWKPGSPVQGVTPQNELGPPTLVPNLKNNAVEEFLQLRLPLSKDSSSC